jgi:class 3 adenylate cyclase/predicted ATPase
MDYDAIVAQVLTLLQQEQRLAYRVLKRRFQLDDDLLEDLKDDLIYAKHLAVDEDGKVLVWTGGTAEHLRQEASPALRATAPPPDAERRHLTVLFCDLVDSTVLARQLDPEDLREVVRAYQDTCAKVIARFDGHIAQYLGDGLLVYFGYPLAHEDDAQRAVRAGLGMVEALGQLNTRLARDRGVQLAMRLGIHTGLVVVGEMGGGTRQEQLALGETPNLAARLQGIAALNTVVISVTTFQLLGGFFACQSLGTPFLKGFAPPLSVLWGLARFYLVRAEPKTARELGEQFFSLAQRLQDPALVLEAHRALGQTLFHLGDFACARAYLEQGIALYDPQQHRALAFRYGRDPGVDCRDYTAWALWMLGYPDQAVARIHEALPMAQELSHPFTLAATLILAAILDQFCREVDTVQARAAAAVALSTEHGFPYFLAVGTILRGWTLAIQGQGEAGMAQMRQGLAAWRATGAEFARPYFVALLAEAYGQDGQVEEGLAVLAEALAAVHATEERWWEAELHRLKGELLWQQGTGQTSLEAEASFHQALEIARRQQAKSLELRAATSLSRLWQRQGKRQEAHDLLAPVYNWFTEGFDTADLQRAKALLDELEDGR